MGKPGKYLSAPRVIGVAWVMCLLPPRPILSRQSQMIKPKPGKRLWSEDGKRHSQNKSPCKVCKTSQKMPVLVEPSNKQVLRQGYRVAGNDFER